jgi:GTP-binding protein EngB required for normal cell division
MRVFGDYMRARNGTQRVAIEHYLENNIDAAFLVFMIRKGMILNDHDRSMVPYIQERYRKINFGLNDIKDFLVKLEGKL